MCEYCDKPYRWNNIPATWDKKEFLARIDRMEAHLKEARELLEKGDLKAAADAVSPIKNDSHDLWERVQMQYNVEAYWKNQEATVNTSFL